ncbi:MAG: hypothetical protein QME94_02970 [Anaerolineae bacterium]|nr:hypothetical protein [Anaerolineae bacterium]
MDLACFRLLLLRRSPGPPAVPRRDRALAILAALGLMALVLGAATACDSPRPSCATTPEPTPTISILATSLVGTWEVVDGEAPKAPVILGERAEFQPGGAFTWGKRQGTYSVYRDVMITLRWQFGESFEYETTIQGDLLTIVRYTACGKQERFALRRVK